MKLLYFNGFCLNNESEVFNDYIENNDFTVSGFSYGAIKAVKSLLDGELSKKRVDKLQLFSPAFFNDKDKKYVRLQLMFFKKDAQAYCDNFLHNCGFRDEDKDKYFSMGTYEELQELLEYRWEEETIKKLLERGIKIEVYLGSEDKIIDSSKALEFFKQFTEVYFIKNKGHIL
jgi:hypothetical protein